MVNINEAILPIASNCRCGTKMTPKWIVIHETGNKDKGANAKAHANYLNNVTKAGTPYVSWHFTVDSNGIYQHIPENEISWNAGDWNINRTNGGCACGISIELCVNSDGDFNKTMQNAYELVAMLMKKWNLGANVGGIVRQHWEFSKKNCPETIRAMGIWQQFLNSCQAQLEKLNSPPSPPPITDYKALYEESQRQLSTTTNALAKEKSRADLLEIRAVKLQNAIIEIEKIIQNAK